MASVSTSAETLGFGRVGAIGSSISLATLFDAASLTKPFVATLALLLHEEGSLRLETRLGDVWPKCARVLASRRLEDLLRHRAGLRPWTALYRRCRTREGAQRLLLGGELAGGVRGVYSDLDYILWGFAAERVLRASLWELLQSRVLEPLAIDGVATLPGRDLDVARCYSDNRREIELAAAQGLAIAKQGGPERGQPQDGNARFLGGLAGHAGLFVSHSAALELGRAWLGAVTGHGGLLPQRLALRALRGRGPWALGWARRRVRGSAGAGLSPSAFGHIGSTGTSLWIDHERDRIYVLLAHRRVLDSESNRWRRRFHSLASELYSA